MDYYRDYEEFAAAFPPDQLQKALQRHRVQEQLTGRTLFARIGSILGAAAGALGVPSLSTRSAQVVNAYWWLPAGLAVLVLLRAIIGG
jgi:hypothetical protein